MRLLTYTCTWILTASLKGLIHYFRMLVTLCASAQGRSSHRLAEVTLRSFNPFFSGQERGQWWGSGSRMQGWGVTKEPLRRDSSYWKGEEDGSYITPLLLNQSEATKGLNKGKAPQARQQDLSWVDGEGWSRGPAREYHEHHNGGAALLPVPGAGEPHRAQASPNMWPWNTY